MAPTKVPAWKHRLLPKEGELINSVAISGDGSRVVAGTYFFNAGPTPVTKTVGMFGFDGFGKPLWQAPDTYLATFGINWVAISRDGRWAASGGQVSNDSGFIDVYDATSGKKTCMYNCPARTQMVALNNDGSALAAGADQLYVFSRKSGTNTWASPQTISYANATVQRVAISADGKWIAAAIDGGIVSLVKNDLASGRGLGPHAVWSLSNVWIMWVAMAADGSGFAAAGDNGTVYYFNIKAFADSPAGTLQPAWQVAFPGCAACRSVAVSADGSLISAVADLPNQPTTGKAFLLANRGNSGAQLWSTPPTIPHGVNSTSMDAKGRFVTVSDGDPKANVGDFSLFEAKTGKLLWTYRTPQMNWPMQISADASAIAAGSDDGNVYYFSVP
jgi:WD40 repeat protein